jgi:hypothetical protein
VVLSQRPQGLEAHRETHGTRALLSATKLTFEQGGLRARGEGT